MNEGSEQCLDIIKNCNDLLKGYLSHFSSESYSFQGKMISELTHLVALAESGDLRLPVAENKLLFFLEIVNSGSLFKVKRKDKIILTLYDIEHLNRKLLNLCNLLVFGKFLAKPIYYSFVSRLIEQILLFVQDHTDLFEKIVNDCEQLIVELKDLKKQLMANKIRIPIILKTPDFSEILILYESSVSFIINKPLCVVYDFVFKGIRPDNWINYRSADKESIKLMISESEIFSDDMIELVYQEIKLGNHYLYTTFESLGRTSISIYMQEPLKQDLSELLSVFWVSPAANLKNKTFHIVDKQKSYEKAHTVCFPLEEKNLSQLLISELSSVNYHLCHLKKMQWYGILALQGYNSITITQDEMEQLSNFVFFVNNALAFGFYWESDHKLIYQAKNIPTLCFTFESDARTLYINNMEQFKEHHFFIG